MREDNFHWGVATSAFQTEGAWNKDGKGPSIWDTFTHRSKKIARNENADNATDFYHRFQSDLDIVQELGIPNFRFSISWPRVIPNGYGARNYKGIDFYDRLTDECLSRSITPWCTLYHWDLPQALEEKGGWTNRNSIDWYGEYARTMVAKLGDRIKFWMALNEPLAFTGAGYYLGVHAPGRKGFRNFIPALHHAALAQAEGIRIIRSECPEGMAGTTFSCSGINAYSESEKDQRAVVRLDALLNRLFIEPLLGQGYPVSDLPFLNQLERFMRPGDERLLKAIPDFAGLQVYTREVVKHAWHIPYLNLQVISAKNRNVPVTEMNWEIYPPSLLEMVRKFNAYSEIPHLVITENGAAFSDYKTNGVIADDARLNYLQRHIAMVETARKEGCRLKGYFAWSLTDNFEWSEGYRPRFGLVHIDFTNGHRTIKNSGFWYSRMIRSANRTKESFVEGGQPFENVGITK